MENENTAFRLLYHKIGAIKLSDHLRQYVLDCPEIETSTHIVVYGFVDPEDGLLMLEVLGTGKQARKYFHFKPPYEGERITLKSTEIGDVPFSWFDQIHPAVIDNYQERIDILKQYDAPEMIEESRQLEFLDPFRNPVYPDQISVRFEGQGKKAEDHWVKITGLAESLFLGTLLEQPAENFLVNEKDTVIFYANGTPDNFYMAAHMGEPLFSESELEDGTILKQAVSYFEKYMTDSMFRFVISVLCNARVFIPYASENMPAVLEGDGQDFFSVFSSEEELDTEVDMHSVMKEPFMKIVAEANRNRDIDGIVLNAFTEPFVIPRSMFYALLQTDNSQAENAEETGIVGKSEKTSIVSDLNEMKGIQMRVGKMDVFNYALYQNNVPAIRDISILNTTGDPAEGLSLHIWSDFDFFKKYEAALPSIPSGKPVNLDDPKLIINGKNLSEMTETIPALITVELQKDGEPIVRKQTQMKVLAYDQWQGDETYQDLLPAFVLPNHPVVTALMHDAAYRLKKWGKPTSLEGYQMHDANRVRDLAAAAYAAIQKKNIVYAEPPASFSIPGQRIRTPESIIEQRLGTCMDMTLLYAALLEAMGLHPLLVLNNGHIFAGVWLRERSFEEMMSSNTVINNADELVKRFGTGMDELTFVECTMMCSGTGASFEEAEREAKRELSVNGGEFKFAIDVSLARKYDVRPIPARVRNNGEYKIEIEELGDSEVTEAPKNLGISIVELSAKGPKKITNKRELWESKLLDLSQHNMLLSLPLNASVMPIMSSHIDELEDALADGHEFHLLPSAEWITALSFTTKDEKGNESKPKQWLQEAINQFGIYEMTSWPVGEGFDFNEKFRQEFRSHRLYTFCSQKQLDRELTTIYRAARSSQQENGVSSLYLAIGLMRWFAEDSKTPSYAPLILLPVEIIRKFANQGYGLHARDEEPHFNTTLLEMLKQNYNLEIAGLDPLPRDSHGIDIKKTFAIIRGALYSLPGWDVVESCVIGNFSFAQFAMWNDIHTGGDMLDNSKVVRSLMKGHVDWNINQKGETEEQNTYLPITVDATQLKAIELAAKGNTFVLHGPPGTGKSQTITGMIANLMAQGKTVLFVAEKMAALSVVQRRLTQLGIGDFCLELHSDKANKKHVLAQFERVLAVKQSAKQSEYEEQLKTTAASRARLDGYAKHLHSLQNSGFSLRDLIDLYETVRDEEKMIRFDPYEAGQLSRAQIQRHVPLLGQLAAAGEVITEFKDNPLKSVGMTSYGSEVRSAMRKYAQTYRNALEDIQMSAEKPASFLQLDKPDQKAEYSRMNQILQLFEERKDTEPSLFGISEEVKKEVESWFKNEEKLQKEEEKLLENWKKDFLMQDMTVYYAKHDAAGKKFFGKNAAMAAVVKELQAFSLKTLTFDAIPTLLKEIQKYQDLKKKTAEAEEALSEGAKAVLEETPTKEEFIQELKNADVYRKQNAEFPGGPEAIHALSQNTDALEAFAAYQKQYEIVTGAEKQFNELLQKQENTDEQWVEKEIEFCDYLTDHPSALKDWGLYNQVRQECLKAGLKPAVDAFENGMEPKYLVSAYKKGLYYALITEIISTDDVLSSFSGVTFNEAIRQFKRLDDNMLEQTRKEIFCLLASRVPSPWDSPETGRELNLLRKAIGSNARGMSIRSLFDRVQTILPLLCPCMLMSPNSVAQYLRQKNNMFDVVIFDEASQLPTCKAVGALSRAKDAVIVGDPKQMPPTSFFAGSGPNVEDLALDDLDSILDDALALGIPSQHLQWHYRSKHESLIAFSNTQFYNNKMFTFPSANDRERHVTAVHVNGIYTNGTNIKEAEAVVAEIVKRFHDSKLRKQSIGVVTFNVKQQTLIENLLTKQYQSDQKLDMWANGSEDPLFVKNLENVQGDERDVILFSIGYGPDERGRISMNFGPINQAGGGKRLNVAFSRARVTMTIFASIYSADIKVTENSPEGLIAFRDFLKYAEGQGLNTSHTDEEKDNISNSGILQSICRTIEAQGFECVPMVGHSDFHIDIAVVDPYDPTKYLMGILLDGEGYRKTKNTRDREVAQIGVLKNLGWILHRIWTIDWWDNRDKELKKLTVLLEKLKEDSQKKHEKEALTEEEKQSKEIKRQEQEEAIRKELEKQAAEVIADDEEAESGEKEVHSTRRISDPQQDHLMVSKKKEPEVTRVDNSEKEESLEDLFKQLKEKGIDFIDKRDAGGALWAVGGQEMAPLMQKFRKYGIRFVFKPGGGKGTHGRDGWWSRTDITLPDFEENTADLKEEKKKRPVKQQKTSETKQDVVISEEKISEEPKDWQGFIYQIEPVQYEYASLSESETTPAEYVLSGNKEEIGRRALQLVDVEAPILRDELIRRVIASFGINRSPAVIEATEKALKAVKIKTSKQKGVVFCWKPDQNPKRYPGLRINPDRAGNAISPQEFRNAVLYLLKEKEGLTKDELVREMLSLFGYKRLGKNLEAALLAGVQYTKASGAVIVDPTGVYVICFDYNWE